MAVILVNGWTDAPNAIATCVSTRSISAKSAIVMAAIFNFLGVLLMTVINANVAQTIYNMVDFGGNSYDALVALCAALFAIVIWATAAWWFGIPTSESHALIAGISGAAIALHNGLQGINGSEWIKVLYGLGLSTFLGFTLGWIVVRMVEIIFRSMSRTKVYGSIYAWYIFSRWTSKCNHFSNPFMDDDIMLSYYGHRNINRWL